MVAGECRHCTSQFRFLATGAGMSQLKVAHCTAQAVLTAERPNFGRDRSIPCDAPESYNVRTRLRHRHRETIELQIHTSREPKNNNLRLIHISLASLRPKT